MGEMLNVGFSDALPPMLRLRKLVPLDSVTSPLTPSVVAQLNGGGNARGGREVYSFFGGDAGDVEKQQLLVEHLCNLVVAKHLSLEHRRSSAAADSNDDRTGDNIEDCTTA